MFLDIVLICFSSKPNFSINPLRNSDSEPDASLKSSSTILDFISSVALLVKVTANICLWLLGLEKSKFRYSPVRRCVLPDPADAFIICNDAFSDDTRFNIPLLL